MAGWNYLEPESIYCRRKTGAFRAKKECNTVLNSKSKGNESKVSENVSWTNLTLKQAASSARCKDKQ